mmetsp:Transcript_8527/g.10016  ORF Transcript_8527/g.10016 Transcript_8527/m.10016 type:complete len:271 (-) Transcript_8527:226-1038(-)
MICYKSNLSACLNMLLLWGVSSLTTAPKPNPNPPSPLKVLSPATISTLQMVSDWNFPGRYNMTVAISEVSNAGVFPQHETPPSTPSSPWEQVLESGSPWRIGFEARPDALKAVRRQDYPGPPPVGKWFRRRNPTARWQSYSRSTAGNANALDNGTYSDTVSLLWGVVRFIVIGNYRIQKRRMTIRPQTIQLKLLKGIIFPLASVKDGSIGRRILERLRGGKAWRKTTLNASFAPRPNAYGWCYADDSISVAQGSGGLLRVWISERKAARS